MPIGIIEGIELNGISCVLPTNQVFSVDRYANFGKEAVDKIIEKTGVESVFHTYKDQTASDLAFVAAERLIEEKNVQKDKIGALIFVSQTPDYRMPATSFVLQHRLGLSESCICFDINLGCSGYVNGLFAISSLMKSSNIDQALLLVAETPSKRISPLDRSLSMIFGDCGTATLLEKKIDAEIMRFKFKSMGGKFDKIIVPAGAYRNINASHERIASENGIIRSGYDTYMDGQDVFSFSILDVPPFIKGFLNETGTNQADYDKIILHQANQFILKQIAKKLKANILKVPISMLKYGNTSSTSIPLALAFSKENENDFGVKRTLLAGFGIGLSIAVADVHIDYNDILPIIHSDLNYSDGIL